MNNNIDREGVIQALETVLKDARFRLSPKSSAFLRYVVTQTLDGNAERIKAYSIAVDALGKPPTFDARNNPSVRVLALRVRRMLSEYYSENKHHDIVLKVSSGSYVPQFIQTQNLYDKAN